MDPNQSPAAFAFAFAFAFEKIGKVCINAVVAGAQKSKSAQMPAFRG